MATTVLKWLAVAAFIVFMASWTMLPQFGICIIWRCP
jgi:hypothetical protein